MANPTPTEKTSTPPAPSTLAAAYLQPSASAAGAVSYRAPDLRKHPPRSPRTRLGGFAQLPRMIDKARAVAAGTAGDYHYNCPFDQQILGFTGISADAFMAEIKAGRTDSELLAFIRSHLNPKRSASEIESWSRWFETWTPSLPEKREFFNSVHRQNAAHRDDISTWCDWVELDDFVTFGGQP
ncbi:MAG TPA: DUF5069 domain-containing protein [Opitutaceae bacterium]|nr:DUF5069 domain-containing protein [Opitutaceae bacterium]